MKRIGILLIAIFVMGCKGENKPKEPIADSELEELFGLMQGSFNSATQAEADSTYFNISLHMYPIWEEHGNYLYVEQAMNSAQDRPYRQRIYEVKRHDDVSFSSTIYTLPNDSLWVGKWREPGAFDRLTPDSLELRKGCDVFLKRIGEKNFKGETEIYSCKSSLRGATYATSEVEIFADRIISWDRGFDAEGNHVWGAIKGGYVFDRLAENE